MTYKGQLKDVPSYIVEQMLQEQEEQGNKRDAFVFENNIEASKFEGGFNWDESSQGKSYWDFIIVYENYKYLPQSFFPTPLTYEPLEEKVMLVSKDGGNWSQRVVFGKKNGKILSWNGAATLEKAKEIHFTALWVYAKEIEEPKKVVLTMDEIAKLANCKVEDLQIEK